MDGLNNVAYSVEATYNTLSEGDYSVGDDGLLYKGDLCISDTQSYLDTIAESSDVELTVFFDDVRLYYHSNRP